MGGSSWASRLGSARRTRMVGRDADLLRLTAFGRADGSAARLLYIHGAGGSGKTLLLREWLRGVADEGARVALIDGQFDPSRPAAIEAAAAGATLIAIDDLHRLAPLESWFFDVFLPSLPEETRVVVTSRRPPRAQEMLDPAWRELMEVMELPPLGEADCLAYLSARGVAEIDRAAVLAFAHGIPLWLCVAADLALAHPDRRFEVTHTREKLRPIIEQLLEETDSLTRRRALQATSLLAVTTESMLTRVLAEDPAQIALAFRWLCDRPYVQRAAEGIRLHDTLRDAMRADLMWRDPELAHAMLDRAYAGMVEQVWRLTGVEQERKIVQLSSMLAHEPGGMALGGPGEQDTYADAIADDELHLVYDALERHEGKEAARIASLWLRHQREGLVGFRDARRKLIAFVLYVQLTEEVPEELRAADPFVSVALGYLREEAPLRAGERATMARWWVSLESYQRPVPIQFRLFAHMGWRLVFTGDPVGASVHADPDDWLNRPDRPHDLFGLFELEGRRYALFGTDWRRRSRQAWISGFIASLRAVPAISPGPEPEFVVLSRDRFDQAVRGALRGYTRRDRLGDNALLGTLLVGSRAPRGGPAEERVEALAGVIADAVARLASQASTRRHARALEHAFLRSKRKGLAIADELGLPYGSYRRILNEAVQLVVDELWERELAAGPPR